MIESLSKVLVANGLDPDSFTASAADERIFCCELPPGRVMETWMKLAKAASETKYWPIIRDALDDYDEADERDANAILAAVPQGNIREILKPRMEQRRKNLAPIMPAFSGATDIDELARLADIKGIHLFGPNVEKPWPTEAPDRVTFHSVKNGHRLAMLLVKVEHSHEVPAYLGFGGWNDCPPPELQVAVLREWHREYNAIPVCITSDVLECAVLKPPQTEVEAMKLAAEQWIFCEDIVGQGTQTIRRLAMEIWRSPQWFLWWD
jgi:hypothetical protein